MNTRITIYTEKFGDISIDVVWQPVAFIEGTARCEQSFRGAVAVLAGPCVPIQSIVHEIHHAVNWCAALERINGREAEAHCCGQLVEETIAAMLRSGWTYALKTNEGALWNLDVKVALQAPPAALI